MVKSLISRDDGTTTETCESVEGVIIFHPKSLAHVKRIVDFLLGEAPKVEGGYSEPDIRVTATNEIKDFYKDSDVLQFSFANIYKFKEGNVITLTPNSEISEEGWENEFNLINKELFGYLTDPRLPIG